MWIFATIPFFLQLIAMLFDEGYFHIKRGLPKWEKIGHPLDTLSVLLCIGFTLFVPFSTVNLKIYIALAIFSSILVTKDEFVHKHHCPASENWLHALLFTLHPITLCIAGFIWPIIQDQELSLWIHKILNNKQNLKLFMQVQFCMGTLFLFYQIIFWNFIWKDKPVLKQ
jgi:hypothetical protein